MLKIQEIIFLWGPRQRPCGQFSPSDDVAFGHRCFLCPFQQCEGATPPSETSFTALNSISSGVTTFPCPCPQLSPSHPK